MNVCNFADDTTPFVCKLNLEVVLTQLEECSELVIAWFQNNYMKLNTDKCHLLVAGHKFEHTWVRVGPDKIWEDHSVKLLGVSIDNKLKFDKHVLNIIKKANSKLSALSRLTKFMILQRKRTLYKAFVESQFKYCPLTWILHSLKTNYKINRLQDRPLRLIYNDHISSFEELLSKDGTFTIHEQNIQNLAIEMFKALNDLSTPDFSELFPLNESLYGLRSNGSQKHCIPNINSVRFCKVSIRYFGPVTWNSLPAEIRNANTLSSFKNKIRKWRS